MVEFPDIAVRWQKIENLELGKMAEMFDSEVSYTAPWLSAWLSILTEVLSLKP